jgi:cytochrome c553
MAYGGSAMMATVAGLSDADIDNLVAFIRSLKQ